MKTRINEKKLVRAMAKRASLFAVAAFQLAAGAGVLFLLFRDLAVGRYHGWHALSAVASGCALGLGGVASAVLYAAFAVQVRK